MKLVCPCSAVHFGLILASVDLSERNHYSREMSSSLHFESSKEYFVFPFHFLHRGVADRGLKRKMGSWSTIIAPIEFHRWCSQACRRSLARFSNWSLLNWCCCQTRSAFYFRVSKFGSFRHQQLDCSLCLVGGFLSPCYQPSSWSWSLAFSTGRKLRKDWKVEFVVIKALLISQHSIVFEVAPGQAFKISLFFRPKGILKFEFGWPYWIA